MKEFDNLYEILKQLRGDHGCPWDKKQTPNTLKQHLIEEAYELLDAINNDDFNNIKEEIGDVYLVISMIALIYEENQQFTIEDCLKSLTEKLIFRHPHVFGDVKVTTAAESLAVWNDQKIKEGRKATTYLEKTGRGLPPLERGLAIEKKLKKIGYTFNSAEESFAKVEEEFEELAIEVKGSDKAKQTDELGDVFLTLICLANQLGIDPSEALHKANNKVVARFNIVEAELAKQNLTLEEKNKDAMDAAWQVAKERLASLKTER